MSRGRRGADRLAQAFSQAGVKRLFTLSGNHIMPFFDAAIDAGIELVHARHEAAAVHMADAWARLTGQTGVAMVTGGPGHTNAVTALYTAAMAESPVLLLSGHAPTDQLGMGAFQEMAQAEIAAPLAKASWTSTSPDGLAGDFAKAVRVARSGRPGPVHLSLPSDCLERDAAETPIALGEPTTRLQDRDAQAILEALQRARRPLVVTGPSSLTAAGRERVAKLEQACGIPVVGTESPRGTADPSLGAFAEMLAQADCVLLLGKRLDFTLKFGKPPAFRDDCEFLQVDADLVEIGRTRRAVSGRLRHGVVADFFPAVDALAAHARAASHGAWKEEVRAAIEFRPAAWETARSNEPGRLHPVQALRPLQALLDAHPRSVFISDGGEIGQWAQACLRAPQRVINGVAGSIGAALPFAIGARYAEREAPVIAVMGDGTFGFHCAEMDTAVRYALPFTAVVGNDARWNAEYQIQLREYGRERARGCELLPARYDEVTAAFGGHGERVTRAEDLMPAARRAEQSGKPACLNVMIEGLPAPNIRRNG
ncbi:MAG TPA: thiamine pyrophosphate-binding protein [Usitatibacter sp.]|nr:thiamine pyrophosphate-binding protein [Usitatibacter sp.]